MTSMAGSSLSETILISSGMAHNPRQRIAIQKFQILRISDVQAGKGPLGGYTELGLERLSFTVSSGFYRWVAETLSNGKRWRLAKPLTSRGLNNHGKEYRKAYRKTTTKAEIKTWRSLILSPVLQEFLRVCMIEETDRGRGVKRIIVITLSFLLVRCQTRT